jgi:multidrug transporter EmrE-like cation transporter
MLINNNILLNIVCAISVLISNSLFKYSIQKSNFTWNGNIVILIENLYRLMSLPTMWIGISFFILSNILWIIIVSSQKMVLAYPLHIGLCFILIILSSFIIFKEQFSLMHFIGITLIFSGIFIISSTGLKF